MQLYHSVIEDVVSSVRESFLDDGVDEQVLVELKQLWESKLQSTKAVEPAPEPQEAQTMGSVVRGGGIKLGGVKRPAASGDSEGNSLHILLVDNQILIIFELLNK